MRTSFNINPFDRGKKYFSTREVLLLKTRHLFCLLGVLILIISGCSKDSPGSKKQVQNEPKSVSNNAEGATQIAGVAFYATSAECDAAGQGATFAIKMTGDLEGCHYVFVDAYDCSPSGTYREQGREYFVGTYKGQPGTFWTGYKFEGKYEDCGANGAALGLEIFGRCQHPITPGTGTGVFEGVTGRLDFKDDIEAGNFPYRGHLKY